MIKTIILILFLLLLIINRKETFQNYIIFDNDRKNFYMKFIDYVLTSRKNDYFIYKNHLISNQVNPQIINNSYMGDHLWMNPNNRIVLPI
jgi:hypothetical protein